MRIFVTGEITDETTAKLLNCAFQAKEDEVIYIFIDSDGGESQAAKAIFYSLKALDRTVVTCVIGRCKSSAVLIALAGEQRFALEHSEYMIHPVRFEDIEGMINAEELAALTAELKTDKDAFYRIISSETKLTPYKIIKHIEDSHNGTDWNFNTKVAKKYGLITDIGLPE